MGNVQGRNWIQGGPSSQGPMATPTMPHQPGSFNPMQVTPAQAMAQLAAVANLNIETITTPQQAKAELEKIEQRKMFLAKSMEAMNLKRAEMMNTRPPNIDPATFEAQLGGLNNQLQKFQQIAARFDQVKAQVGQRLEILVLQEQSCKKQQVADDPADMYVPLSIALSTGVFDPIFIGLLRTRSLTTEFLYVGHW